MTMRFYCKWQLLSESTVCKKIMISCTCWGTTFHKIFVACHCQVKVSPGHTILAHLLALGLSRVVSWYDVTKPLQRFWLLQWNVNTFKRWVLINSIVTVLTIILPYHFIGWRLQFILKFQSHLSPCLLAVNL